MAIEEDKHRLNAPNNTRGESSIARLSPEDLGGSTPLATSQALVVIGYLIDDLKAKQPSLPYPPTWLIKRLMQPKCAGFRASLWLRDIRTATYKLLEDCDRALVGELVLREINIPRALFPTYDGYTLEEFRHFLKHFMAFLNVMDQSCTQAH